MKEEICMLFFLVSSFFFILFLSIYSVYKKNDNILLFFSLGLLVSNDNAQTTIRSN